MKRFLSLMLAAIMIMGVLPVNAIAENEIITVVSDMDVRLPREIDPMTGLEYVGGILRVNTTGVTEEMWKNECLAAGKNAGNISITVIARSKGNNYDTLNIIDSNDALDIAGIKSIMNNGNKREINIDGREYIDYNLSVAGISKDGNNVTVNTEGKNKYFYYVWVDEDNASPTIYETFEYELINKRDENGNPASYTFTVSDEDYIADCPKVVDVQNDIPENVREAGADAFFSTNDGRGGIDTDKVTQNEWIEILRAEGSGVRIMNANVKITAPNDSADEAVLYRAQNKLSEAALKTAFESSAAETVEIIDEKAEFPAKIITVSDGQTEGMLHVEAKDGREYWYIKWVDTDGEGQGFVQMMQFDTYAGGDSKPNFDIAKSELYPQDIDSDTLSAGENEYFSAAKEDGKVIFTYKGSEKKASKIVQFLENEKVSVTVSAPENALVSFDKESTFSSSVTADVDCVENNVLDNKTETVLVYFKGENDAISTYKFEVELVFSDIENDTLPADCPVAEAYLETPEELEPTGSWFDSYKGETGVDTTMVSEQTWISLVKAAGKDANYVAAYIDLFKSDGSMDEVAVRTFDEKLTIAELNNVISGLQDEDFAGVDNNIPIDVPVLDINDQNDGTVKLEAVDSRQYMYFIWRDNDAEDGSNIYTEMIRVDVVSANDNGEKFSKIIAKDALYPKDITEENIIADDNAKFESIVSEGSVVYKYKGQSRNANELRAELENEVLTTIVNLIAPDGYAPVRYEFGDTEDAIEATEDELELALPCVYESGDLNEDTWTAIIYYEDADNNTVMQSVNISIDCKDTRDASTVPDMVYINVPEPIEEYIECEYTDDGKYGIINVTVKNATKEAWKAIYEELSPDSGDIIFDVEIPVPSEFDKVRSESTGQEYTLEDFINMTQDPYDGQFDDNEGYRGSGIWVANINRSGKSVIITPHDVDEAFYVAMVDYDGDTDEDGDPVPRIVRKALKIFVTAEKAPDGGNQQYVFEDVFKTSDFVPADRIGTSSDNTDLFESEYDEETGILTYRYVGTKTTYDDLVNELRRFENDPLIAFITAPEGSEGEQYEAYRITSNTMDQYFDYSTNMMDAPTWVFNGDYISCDDTFTLFWKDRSGNKIIEKLTIKIDIGDIERRVWMDEYWKPVSSESGRLMFTQNIGYLRDNGMFVTANEKGHIVTEYRGTVRPQNIDRTKAYILPPANAVYFKENQSSGTGDIIYSNTAENQNQFVENSDLIPVSEYYPNMGIANIDSFEVEGITVWLAHGTDRTQVMVINWYDENGDYISGDYIYFNGGDCVQITEENAVEKIETEVSEPTPLGKGWFLTCKQFAQHGNDKNYYFQLEAGGNVPGSDTEKIVYLPYSFIEAGLTYEKAIERGLNPKLHHYDDGHNELEMIKGECTPYGIKFVTKSFSPFVLEWTANNVNNGAEDNKEDDYREKEYITIVINNSGKKEDEENPDTGAPVL